VSGISFVIPGRIADANPESRDSGFVLRTPRNDYFLNLLVTFTSGDESVVSQIDRGVAAQQGNTKAATFLVCHGAWVLKRAK
jgi:hypothetical protein